MSEQITTEQQLSDFLQADEPAWIFKHSTTCPISAGAYDQFRRYLDAHDDVPAGVIIVQQNRDLSQKVAEQTGVRHESPQALLVKDGNVLFHASHGSITVNSLENAVKQNAA